MNTWIKDLFFNWNFVDDAKSAWSWLSMQMLILATIIQAVWAGLSASQIATLPDWASTVATIATIVVLVAAAKGRVTAQSNL